MQKETPPPSGDSGKTSYGSVIRELASSLSGLIRSELDLAKAEAQEAVGRLIRHAAQAALFGALFLLSVLPFLAFLVIGLGALMGGNYWLSSLLVALVCATVGGSLAYSAYKKIKEDGMDLPRTRELLEREKQVINGKLGKIREATQRRAV